MSRRRLGAVLALLALAACGTALAAPAESAIELKLSDSAGLGPSSTAVRLLILFTVLAIAPSILLMMTSFVRFVVAFHFLRQALGSPQMPPNQVIIGLSLFMTLFVMGPVIDQVKERAWQPWADGEIDAVEAVHEAAVPFREFMLRNTRQTDLELFVKMARLPQPKGPEELPLRVIVPAYVISELRVAFEIGFLLFLPFLVVDLVVASVLLSMGMMMLPPAMVSLPFKILLFVLVDGWSLIAGSLVAGIR